MKKSYDLWFTETTTRRGKVSLLFETFKEAEAYADKMDNDRAFLEGHDIAFDLIDVDYDWDDLEVSTDA